MLLTGLEIIAFMVAATIIGALLGWVLRGTLGNEQMEIVDLRAQLRQLKKANRESKSAAAPASAAATDSVVDAKTGAVSAAKAKSSDAKKESVKSGSVKSEATTATAKKPAAKKAATAKSAKKSSVRKTQAERQADQAAAAKAFAEMVDRVVKSDADDNLTKIHGVGKKYASMLNDLGISSYAQISMLRKAEVRTLAAALGVLDDRLEAEDWVGSAKTLLKEAKK